MSRSLHLLSRTAEGEGYLESGFQGADTDIHLYSLHLYNRCRTEGTACSDYYYSRTAENTREVLSQTLEV